jgi:hypothetical protein
VAILALIGVKGLYLLFAWLLSAAIGAWISERKGYGERVGLAFGLLLTVVGLGPPRLALEDRGPAAEAQTALSTAPDRGIPPLATVSRRQVNRAAGSLAIWTMRSTSDSVVRESRPAVHVAGSDMANASWVALG